MAKNKTPPTNATTFRPSKIRAQYALDLPGMPPGSSKERYRATSGCPSNKFRGSPACPIQLVYPYPDQGPYLRLCETSGRKGALVRVRSIPQAYQQALALCRAAGYHLPQERKSLYADEVAQQAGVDLERDEAGALVLGRMTPGRKTRHAPQRRRR